MNILFYRYGSICEPDIIEAFQILGHTIYEIKDEIYNKEITPQETIHTVSSFLNNTRTDFIFTINFFPVLSEVCKIYKIPYVCVIVDSPVMTLYSHSITNSCNRIFLFDQALFNEFAPYNPNGIFHIPLAANVTAKQNVIKSASSSELSKFSSDVSFVGSLYTEKSPYDRLSDPPQYLQGFLDGLIETQLRVYGYFFIEELLTDEIVNTFKAHMPGFYQFPENSFKNDRASMAQLYIGNKISAVERTRIMDLLCQKYNVDIYTGSDTSKIKGIHNRGFAKSLTEMPIIFNQSSINLNITCKSIRSGLPQRIFDVLACEGFLITNYQSELPDYFIPEEDLVVYSSFEELSDLVGEYLSKPELCREIAHNGYEKVKENHNYIIRMQQILEIVFAK